MKKYLLKFKWMVLFNVIVAGLFALIQNAIPYVINKFMKGDYRIEWIIGLFILFVLEFILHYLLDGPGYQLSIDIPGAMRKDLFEKIQKLPNQYFDNHNTGEIGNRLMSDLLGVGETIIDVCQNLVISLATMISAFVILFRINCILTISIFIPIPFILYYNISRKKQLKGWFKNIRIKYGELNATVLNGISGIRTSRIFCTEEVEQERFINKNNEFIKSRYFTSRKIGMYFAKMHGILRIVDFITVVGGVILMSKNLLSIPDFVLFNMYTHSFTNPIKTLIKFSKNIQDVFTSVDRFNEIMNMEEENEGTIEVKDLKGNIDINNISFKYDTKNIINNMSLKIKKGQKVALVGPSGGGKSTIVNLITRFYDATSGEIKIDGINIKDMSLKSLRSHIGVVEQSTFLYDGTIKDNILFGNPDASDEEIIEASKKAMLHDYIMTLENGYDTLVGERGIKLSGGQKQRIAIARVFLKDPSIIILDEATSALDNVTEKEIQKQLDELSKGRTSITIAHRLSTIINSDKIVVIDGGIKEYGTHSELLAMNGIYSKLNKGA